MDKISLEVIYFWSLIKIFNYAEIWSTFTPSSVAMGFMYQFQLSASRVTTKRDNKT